MPEEKKNASSRKLGLWIGIMQCGGSVGAGGGGGGFSIKRSFLKNNEPATSLSAFLQT
jgi:hypothetical protein